MCVWGGGGGGGGLVVDHTAIANYVTFSCFNLGYSQIQPHHAEASWAF